MIVLNPFVKRQTADSRFSHFTGTDDELVSLTEAAFAEGTQGYREGVLEIPVEVLPGTFYSGIVRLKEGDALVGSYEARKEGETPRKTALAQGRQKLEAVSVDIIVYASTVLAESGDNTLAAEEGNYEIVSINANPFNEEMPIAPHTLMHNHFGSDGGTATGLEDSEFVAMLRKSFEAWRDKAMCG